MNVSINYINFSIRFFQNLLEVTAVFINQRDGLIWGPLTIKLLALSPLKEDGHLKKV